MKETHWRLYQRWTNHKCRNHWNIFCIKSGKYKTAKSISGCNGYHETYRWNLCRSIGQRLFSLQKTDQRVIQQKFYNPYRIIKLHDGYENMGLILLIFWSWPTCSGWVKIISRLSRCSNDYRLYFSMVKVPLGSVKLRCGNASSRLNT